METPKKKRAVGYVRVSTTGQAEEGVSLDAQRQKIEDYCRLHDLELVGVIQDAGKSAKNMNRPGVQKVLKMAEKRQIDAVVTLKLDRMFRNTVDAANTSEQFKKKGVALHSIYERLDTESAIGEFFFTMLASLAQMERKVTAERTSTALQHMKAQGQVYGPVPYGYSAADGRLIPNAEEQATLARIKELRGKGFSYEKTASLLNAENRSTKSGTAWKWGLVRSVCVRASA
ncbi:recombinase family protein [Desulfovibrio cuneatus]|uniref:recombinase family protein n=1 Tax=Desulfovibrio cuneatus TaxID=159728 RepID=UPI000427DECF|nr:recombinase family protein [Desulfovibrio cuneatus]